MSQDSFPDQLRRKTEAELEQIVRSSSSLTGYAVVNLKTKETFSSNDSLVFPQGSAIKIPILMEVCKQAHEGRFKMSDLRTVERRDIVGGTGVLKDLTDVVSLSVRNLAILMIVLSDNSATNSLIDLVGLDKINSTMNEMGLKNTLVQRRMLDQEASGKGQENVSTPLEAVRIMSALYEGKFIDRNTSSDIIDILKRNSRSNSRLAAGIPSEVPVAFKPGVLDGVSTEWAIVYLPNGPYAIAVMQAYRPRGEADSVIESLSKVIYQYFWRKANSTKFGTYISPRFIK